ncbi:MAG: AMP-binding protein [Lachnospiraceae bacterium]|nr:AMP-binding protein [Lachnospiraceae bacterium]
MELNNYSTGMQDITGNETLQGLALRCRDAYDGTAVICEGRFVSYKEFDETTDRLAAVLAGKGLGPGKIVAVQMRRSEKLIMALFGIMKCGAAFLPLDMDLPEKRKEDIYSAADISITIDDGTADMLLSTETLALSADWTLKAGDLPIAAPEDPALILFTSGSTGKPKGVVHSQNSCAATVLHFPWEMAREGSICRKIDTILAKTKINYVSSFLFEYPQALLTGRTLVVLTEKESNDYDAVGKMICKYPDSSVFMTPSEAASFLREPEFRENFRKLARLILAGEVLADSIREKVLEAASGETTLASLYASTECHAIAWSDLSAWEEREGALCPGMYCEVIDEEGRPLSSGQAGEVVISSTTMLTEYLNADVPRVQIGDKSYFRTGDLGSKTEDGRLHIRGRLDRMVKYHGLRIELGDIENNLCRHPGIRRAAVVVAKTPADTEILCGYYESDRMIDPARLRLFLGKYIPQYMIPTGLVHLSELPLNRNRKVDIKELAGRVYRAQKFEDVSEPSDFAKSHENAELRNMLTETVSQLLGREAAVDSKDNLLELGLDSLLAFRMIAQLKEKGFALGIGEIFANATIEGLANLLGNHGAQEGNSARGDGPFGPKSAFHGEGSARGDGPFGSKSTCHDRDGAGVHDKGGRSEQRAPHGGESMAEEKAGSEISENGLFTATGIQLYWGTQLDEFKKAHGFYISDLFVNATIYNEETFAKRVQEIAARHPAFRAYMVFEDGKPGQRFADKSLALADYKDISLMGKADASCEGSSMGTADASYEGSEHSDANGSETEIPCSGSPYEINEEQMAYVRAYVKERAETITRDDAVMALYAACFQISDKASVFYLLTNHAAGDGDSLRILKEELVAAELPAGRDAYLQYLSYIAEPANIGEAVHFWKGYLHDVDSSALPAAEERGAGDADGEADVDAAEGSGDAEEKVNLDAVEGDDGSGDGEVRVESMIPQFVPVTIRLTREQTEVLVRKTASQGVTLISAVLYAYGKALLKTLDKEALALQLMSSGRGIPLDGIDRTVGCLIQYVPIVIRSGDTPAEFMQGYLKADRYSYLFLPVIWQTAIGNPEPPALAPFLISEIFRPVETDGYFAELENPDYESMGVGNFITMEDGALVLYLHYDAAKTDGEYFRRMAEAMRGYLLN